MGLYQLDLIDIVREELRASRTKQAIRVPLSELRTIAQQEKNEAFNIWQDTLVELSAWPDDDLDHGKMMEAWARENVLSWEDVLWRIENAAKVAPKEKAR